MQAETVGAIAGVRERVRFPVRSPRTCAARLQPDGTHPRHELFPSQDSKLRTEAMMTSREDRIKERAKKVKEDEGISHGRDPENTDPEMLEGEDAEAVRANKDMKRKRQESSDDDPPLITGGRLPPD